MTSEPRLPPVPWEELSSLQEIESYLSTADHIGMMTNADEIILAPGELDYLRELFGNRATVYPRGGHCGNLAFPDNVEDMTAFFKGKAGE